MDRGIERAIERIACVLLLAAAAPAVPAAALPADGGKHVTWKPVAQAVLKLNNHPVRDWNVLEPEKNHNLLLVEVDRDWYVLSLRERRVYRVERKDFQARGDNLIGPEPDRKTPQVRTEGWDSRNVGPAQQVTVRLVESGEELTVELAHPLWPF